MAISQPQWGKANVSLALVLALLVVFSLGLSAWAGANGSCW